MVSTKSRISSGLCQVTGGACYASHRKGCRAYTQEDRYINGKRAAERATGNSSSKKARVADRFADRLQEISTESASRLERTIQSALAAVGTLGQGRSVMEEAMVILRTDFKDEFSREDRLDIISSFREESNARILVNLEHEERLFWLLRLLQEKQR
jgi:hypothetical protein